MCAACRSSCRCRSARAWICCARAFAFARWWRSSFGGGAARGERRTDGRCRGITVSSQHRAGSICCGAAYSGLDCKVDDRQSPVGRQRLSGEHPFDCSAQTLFRRIADWADHLASPLLTGRSACACVHRRDARPPAERTTTACLSGVLRPRRSRPPTAAGGVRRYRRWGNGPERSGRERRRAERLIARLKA